MPITNFKTPGVYLEEIPLLPPSVAAVETAIPIFIGYTQKAIHPDGTAIVEPIRIKSLLEYHNYFGIGYTPTTYTVVANTTSRTIITANANKQFYLYDSLRQFYDNGGGPCYICSVGSYEEEIDQTAIAEGIALSKKYDEPSLILFPDGVGLRTPEGNPDFAALGALHQQAMLICTQTQDRFVLLDLMQGNLPEDVSQQPLQQFRANTGINGLRYAAAYYPWIWSNYDLDINFRQLSFEEENGVSIPDPNVFSANATEQELLTELQAHLANSSLVASIAGVNLLALLQEGITVIQDTLTTLEQEVRDGSAFKSRFTDYLNVLANTTQRFALSEAGVDSDSPIGVALAKVKSSTELQEALKGLVKIEKNAGTFLNTLSSRDEASVQALYEVLDGGWFGSQADDNYSGITPDADFEQSREASLAIISIIKASVLPSLLNQYGILLHTAAFYEKLAAQRLFTQHVFFKGVAQQIKELMRTLPPSGAVAGAYALTDATRGVWKAPANLSLQSVIGPTVKLTNTEQDAMNVHDSGKSVNAIRSFVGKGTLIWGARTLAGNDNEWRYVSVRRFFNMVEESVKKATAPFVFEANNANTWTKVKVMIENFLTLQWRSGALQGSKPEQAFFVSVGLGQSMTANDILEGRMIVDIGMAVVRPAEFIVLRFSHKMMEA